MITAGATQWALHTKGATHETLGTGKMPAIVGEEEEGEGEEGEEEEEGEGGTRRIRVTVAGIPRRKQGILKSMMMTLLTSLALLTGDSRHYILLFDYPHHFQIAFV